MGFGLGRLANFVNGELWGRVTDVPWGVVFLGAGAQPRHPSQLSEAVLEGLFLFVFMVLLARREPPRPPGELVGWLTLGYGACRLFIEFFREPDAALGFIALNWVTMGMLLSLPMVFAGIGLIVWSRKKTL